jgi:hypothetical protein
VVDRLSVWTPRIVNALIDRMDHSTQFCAQRDQNKTTRDREGEGGKNNSQVFASSYK